MRYVVYKAAYGGKVRWYASPLMEGELAPYPIIFLGDKARSLACQKVRELNEKEERLVQVA
jgi:hypothetical protein